MAILEALDRPLYPESPLEHEDTSYGLVHGPNNSKTLAVLGDTAGFVGDLDMASGALLCPLTPGNAAVLRQRLPWLNPVALGTKTSAGFGDRLGIATPGHAAAVRGTGIESIFAQQSVRENDRTGRSPQNVVDDAMWGLFEVGWREDWGADADHLKVPEVVDPFVAAGYSFFTIDPGDHVDNEAQTAGEDRLREKVNALPWDRLQTTYDAVKARFVGQHFQISGDFALDYDEITLLRALAKYGGAVAQTLLMARYIKDKMGIKPFDLEMSVDETDLPTSMHEHFYIASELQRLGIEWVSLAPRFVGRFEKGVDYIGDPAALDENIAQHSAIMRYYGGYKLSLHSGSDKYTVYPIAAHHAQGLVHLKTAGTSYLEGLRVISKVDPAFYREILAFARERYETDRATYHVSAQLSKVLDPAALADADLWDSLDQFDTRQALHVTFGSVLDRWGDRLHGALVAHEQTYYDVLKAHFDKHLQPLIPA